MLSEGVQIVRQTVIYVPVLTAVIVTDPQCIDKQYAKMQLGALLDWLNRAVSQMEKERIYFAQFLNRT